MKGLRLLILGIFLLSAMLAAAPAGAQFWAKKDPAKWSKSECQELLHHSPWANEYRVARAVIEGIAGTATGGDPSVEGRSQPFVNYSAVFLSAKPVRLAMIRLQQLDPKYEKLSPEDRQKFDENAAKFIDADFSNQVVVQMTYETINAYNLPIARYWQTQSQEELRKVFVLVTAAGRIEPVQVIFQPGQNRGEFQLIYPRKIDGKEVLNADFKQAGLEFPHPDIPEMRAVLPPERGFIPFPTKKMIVKDELVY